MHPHDKRLQFTEFRSKGWSIYRISKTIDVPKSTLCDWQKQDKSRIEELREMEQEALEEQLTEQREQEYQRLSSRLDLVEKALDQQLQEKMATLSLMELCRLSSALRSQLGKLERRSSRPASNKMVLFGTNSPENGTAPDACAPCSEGPLQHETGQNRTDPSVRKDSPAPAATETAQQQAPEPIKANDTPSLTPTMTSPSSPVTVPPAPPKPPVLVTASVIPERMIGGIIDPRRIIGRRCPQPSTR